MEAFFFLIVYYWLTDELFSSISKRMPNVRSATSTSELLFSIDFEEAQHINDIFNKFTQCCRNLTVSKKLLLYNWNRIT